MEETVGGGREQEKRDGRSEDVLFVPSSNSTNSRAVSSRSARRDCRRIEAQRVASVVGGGRLWVLLGATMSVTLLSCAGFEVVCGGRGCDFCCGGGRDSVVEDDFFDAWGLWRAVLVSVRDCEWEWECAGEWEWFVDGIVSAFLVRRCGDRRCAR